MRKTRRLVAVIAAVGLVLAACSDDDDGDSADTEATTAPDETTAATEAPGTTATEETTDETAGTTADTTADTTATTEEEEEEEEEEEPTDVDPDGILRIGYDMEAASRGGVLWDPSAAISTGQEAGRLGWLYGSFMRFTGEGELVPDLAESTEVVDPNTIEITLREGLTLSDGTPLDAEMAKASLDANIAKVGIPAFRAPFFSLTSVDAPSPTSLILHFSDGTAASWHDLFLPAPETMIVPPGTDFSNPVGAGPFTLESFTQGQSMTLAKNPAYWDADSIRVAGIEALNVPPTNDQAAVQAINAEQVDWVRLVPATIDAAGGNTEVVVTPDPDTLMQMLVCKSDAPLDDPLVRQALSFAVDRELIIESLLSGNATPAWDLWPEGHPLHNPDLTEYYAVDTAESERLLTEAGVSDIDVSIMPIPAANGPEIAAILQQMWGSIGVNVEIIPTTNFVEDFLTNRGADMGVVPRGSGGRGKLDNFSGPAVGNVCAYSDPELDAMVTELAGYSDSSDEGQQLWYDIQEIYVQDAVNIPLLFTPTIYGILPANVGGYALMSGVGVVPVPDMWTTYIKSS